MQGVSDAFRSGLISSEPGNWADREIAAERAMQRRANAARGNQVMGEQFASQAAGDDGGGMYVRPLEPKEQRGTGGFSYALTTRPGADYSENKAANDARIAENRAKQGGYSDRQLRRLKPAAMASALMRTEDPRNRERMLQAMTPRKAAQVLDIMGKQKRQLGPSAGQQGAQVSTPRVPVKRTAGGAIAPSSRNEATQRIATRFGDESQMAEHLRSLGLGMDSGVADHLSAAAKLMRQPQADPTMMEGVLREIVENAVDRGVVEAETGESPEWAQKWVQNAPDQNAPIGEVYGWVVKEQERQRARSQQSQSEAYEGYIGL